MRVFDGHELLAAGHAGRGRRAPRPRSGAARAPRRRRREGAGRCRPATCAPGRRRPARRCTGSRAAVFVTPGCRGHQRDRRRRRVSRHHERRSASGTPRSPSCSYMNLVEDDAADRRGRQGQRQHHQVPRHARGAARRPTDDPPRCYSDRRRRPHHRGVRRRRVRATATARSSTPTSSSTASTSRSRWTARRQGQQPCKSDAREHADPRARSPARPRAPVPRRWRSRRASTTRAAPCRRAARPADPAIVEATMFNFQDCGETKKASLSAGRDRGRCARSIRSPTIPREEQRVGDRPAAAAAPAAIPRAGSSSRDSCFSRCGAGPGILSAMSLACPSCGVAVLPGYLRCPKCRAKLPFGSTTQSRLEGGTVGARSVVPGRSRSSCRSSSSPR